MGGRRSKRPLLVEEVWCAFLASGRSLHSRARAGVSAGGLTVPRVSLLRLIVARGRTTSKELAEAMRVSTADLPGLLEKLEAEGFVTRRRTTSDRRVIAVEPTTKGRRKLQALWRAAMKQIGVEFSDWSERDLRSFRDLLLRIQPAPCAPVDMQRLPMLGSRRGDPP